MELWVRSLGDGQSDAGVAVGLMLWPLLIQHMEVALVMAYGGLLIELLQVAKSFTCLDQRLNA